MSLLRTSPSTPGRPPVDPDDRPRRGRPPARNEILRAGRLGGLAPEELAERFGTPLYVYDLDVIDRQVEALRAALPGPRRARLRGQGQSGPGRRRAPGPAGPRCGRRLRRRARDRPAGRHRPGADRHDRAGQARRGARLGRPGRDPGRHRGIARRAGAAGGASPAEVGRRQPVMLRAAVSEDARLERVRLVGDDGAGKFGMDADDLVTAARRAAGSPHLELLGLHAFGASNVLDASALVAHVAATGRQARGSRPATGVPVRIVDAGGGLGIPYETHEESLDLVGLGRGLAEVAAAWAEDPFLAEARLLLEPGRFLVGSGRRLPGPGRRHEDRRRQRGRRSSTAASTTCCDRRSSGRSIGCGCSAHRRAGRSRSPSPVRSAPGWTCSPPRPCCHRPTSGDLVAVLDVGAYGFTESMPFFLSHPMPAEVVVRDGGRG